MCREETMLVQVPNTATTEQKGKRRHKKPDRNHDQKSINMAQMKEKPIEEIATIGQRKIGDNKHRPMMIQNNRKDPTATTRSQPTRTKIQQQRQDQA